jgi:LPXTG-motif cell wall-anchored protein
MIRKIFSMIMVAVMMTALAVPAFASATTKDSKDNVIIPYTELSAELSASPVDGMTVAEVMDSVMFTHEHCDVAEVQVWERNPQNQMNAETVLTEGMDIEVRVYVEAHEGYQFEEMFAGSYSAMELIAWRGEVLPADGVEPTEAPVEPVEPTEAPVEPVEPTEEPVEPTEAPVEPVEPTEEPVTTEVPIEKVTPTPEVTEAPVEPTEAPAEPTVAPSIDPTTPGTPATGTVALMGVGVAAIVGGGGAILFRKKNEK